MKIRSYIAGLAKTTLEKYGYSLVVKPSLDDLASYGFDQWTLPIIAEAKQNTMTSYERLHSLCQAIKYVVDTGIEGAFVECGVWRGGSSFAAAQSLVAFGDTKRELYLYDTYEGMSAPTDEDVNTQGHGAAQLLNTQSKSDPTSIWCAAELDLVKQTMGQTEYPQSQVHYVVGKVEDTIPGTIPEKIAVLRLDTDWYESTKHELEHLFELVVPGGIIIFDDYGFWAGAKKAVDEYFEANNINVLLHRIDATGRIAIKSS